MEEIIVSFIHNDSEKDLRLPNHLESKKIAEALHEWAGHAMGWGEEPYDLEYSFNQKNWFRLEKKKSLADAGVWDGSFLRFSKEPQSSLPKEDDFMASDDYTEDNQPEEQTSMDYAWKIID
ncbi:EsaB/YukD family protein [Fictibacillus sp. KU28468]|uniref:EsaB/YukD family protein n=1 Tax=Fictibacillus sp. KU28468 TaxID=2991053 RepID=UPI00223C93AD|nr:EsaB/YukD family protein [Fictibacillus sp. KU28468]UZJ78722.1 EsaB/YukD family protein [Fictibacillus sp. KU28468]